MASFAQVLLHSEVASKITAVSVDENLSKVSYHDIAKITNTHIVSPIKPATQDATLILEEIQIKILNMD